MPEPWTEHLLVESQGPWSGPGSATFLGDAATLARHGHHTRVFLVQDGVLAATPGRVEELDPVVAAGGEVWLDRFSWVHRGLAGVHPGPGARWVDLDEVAARVLDPRVQVVWH